MTDGDIRLLLRTFAARCTTDEQLQTAIRVLKEELDRRKQLRYRQRVQKAADKLTEAECKTLRMAIRKVGNRMSAVIDRIQETTDAAVRDRLRKKKLIFQDSDYLTVLGRNVAYLLQTQEKK